LADYQPDSISRAEAAAELEARRLGARSLVGFRRYVLPQLDIARHHVAIADALEDVLAGVLQLLIIKAPPRHGKSLETSIEFPAYTLGRHPTWEYALASYNDRLAKKFGRGVRNLIRSKRYRNVFPGVEIAPDSRAADEWRLTLGGVMISRGVAGGSTGYGGHIFGIDDPIKDAKEAFSETIRESLWEWFQAVVTSRKMQDLASGMRGAVVLTYTPWHEDDIGSRMERELFSLYGDRARTLRLPCEAEPGDPLGRQVGEPLWPERGYDREWIRVTKATVGPGLWSAMYQCTPLPDAGDYFKAEWFVEYEPHELPRVLYHYGTSDYATENSDGLDWTVHEIWGVDHKGDVWLVDQWRDRADSDVWVEAFCDLVTQYKPLAWAEEQGQILKSVGPWLLRRMTERSVFCRRIQYVSATSKRIRARSYQAAMSQGRVHIPRRAPWIGEWKAEHLRFDKAKHDDMVDNGSLFFRMYEELIRPSSAAAPQSAQMQKGPFDR